MSKKRLNIFLVPLVFLLWIVIIVRIVSFTKPKQLVETAIVPVYEQQNEKNITEPLGLLLNYPDPFNHPRNFISNEKKINSKQKNISSNFFKKQEETVMPKISFSGIIKTENSTRTVGLLIVNNRSLLVLKNDTVNGLKVIEYWQDSVKLEVKNRIITLKR